MNLNLKKRGAACFTCRSSRGFTLAELMVASGVGILILTTLVIVFATSARSFASMGNYVSMDRDSRNALDRMTREIRRAGDLTQFSSTHLTFTKFGTVNSYLVYNWDEDSRQLTEWQTGNTTTNVLLTECDYLQFSMCGSSFTPTSTVSEGKAISATWKCSRTILGKKMTTEDMKQALIVVRNKRL